MKLLPIKGEYYIFNNKVETKDRTYIQKTRKRIGVIQQNSYLIPYLSVFQNIQISLEIQSKDKCNFNDKILKILGKEGNMIHIKSIIHIKYYIY